MQTPKISFVNEQSKLIYEKKEHALVVISPFNSYYSEEKIEKILRFIVEEKFQDFNIFTGEGLWYYNFLALGYSEKEALQKTKKEDSFLHRRIKRVLEKLGISDQVLLQKNEYEKIEIYQKLVNEYEKYFSSCPEFVQCLDAVVSKMNVQKFRNIFFEDIKIAFHYFFKELPFVLQTPSILQKNSSIFIYNTSNLVFDFLYQKSDRVCLNQGFLTLEIFTEAEIIKKNEKMFAF